MQKILGTTKEGKAKEAPVKRDLRNWAVAPPAGWKEEPPLLWIQDGAGNEQNLASSFGLRRQAGCYGWKASGLSAPWDTQPSYRSFTHTQPCSTQHHCEAIRAVRAAVSLMLPHLSLFPLSPGGPQPQGFLTPEPWSTQAWEGCLSASPMHRTERRQLPLGGRGRSRGHRMEDALGPKSKGGKW